MNTTVNIVEVPDGPHAWLCGACTEAQPGAKVTGRAERPCDVCWQETKSETPAYVLTSPDARLPTAAECPPPRKIAPWAKSAASKQTRTQPRAA